MSRDPAIARDFNREAALQQELEAVWLDMEHTLPLPAAHWPSVEATLPPALELVVDCPQLSATPAVDAGQLVYARHDSSMLFSATMFRAVAMSGVRQAATSAAPATTVRGDDAGDTFVPIAVVAPASRYDAWLWGSLTLAMATMLFFLVVVVDLFVAGR